MKLYLQSPQTDTYFHLSLSLFFFGEKAGWICFGNDAQYNYMIQNNQQFIQTNVNNNAGN